MEVIFSPQPFLSPELSLHAQAFIRTAYGLLLCGSLMLALPHWRRFFLSERWGGYAQSLREVELVQNPVTAPLVLAVWWACGVLIAAGVWSPWPAVSEPLILSVFFYCDALERVGSWHGGAGIRALLGGIVRCPARVLPTVCSRCAAPRTPSVTGRLRLYLFIIWIL